jgi:tetratricopeptide (TPR) repeat protein
MQIRRDWSQPFFSTRRRRRRLGLWVVVYVLGLAGFLFLVDSQFNSLQMMALNVVGQAPPPTPFASDLATQGMNRYLAGNVREAMLLLQQAASQQPRNVDYLYEYGRMLLEMGNDDPQYYTQAIAVGDQAIAANPNDPRGYALKARALDLSGDPANAIPVGQQGLNVDRNFAPLYSALSSAYRNIDRYDVALENAERAIELDPYDASARRIYSYALTWVGRYDEAVDQLEQAITINPNMAGPYFELAGMYRALAAQSQDTIRATELYADSIALYEQILAMQPENARAYLRLCDAYFEARENRRAQDYCEEAVRLNPQYSQAWASLGQSRYSQRNYEGAIDAFELCVETAGEIDSDIRCLYLRGLAHYYLNDCDLAWSILSDSVNRVTATSSDPNNPVLLSAQEGLRLVTVSCAAYRNRALPTPIPPTAIPPTPIGG